jgi:hypothetical protein
MLVSVAASRDLRELRGADRRLREAERDARFLARRTITRPADQKKIVRQRQPHAEEVAKYLDVPALIGYTTPRRSETRQSPSVSKRDAAAIVLVRDGEGCQLAFRRPVILTDQRIVCVSPEP